MRINFALIADAAAVLHVNYTCLGRSHADFRGILSASRFAKEIAAVFDPYRSVRRTGLLVAGLLCLANVAPAAAQSVHEHEHVGAAVASIQLDAGHKWATDASLRSGMAGIRTALDADHPAIDAGKESDAQYEALASRIEAQGNLIVANCRLPPAADASLHYVIADLLQGVNLMTGKDPARTRHDGAALVHGAMIAYGKYFDDPEWTSESSANH